MDEMNNVNMQMPAKDPGENYGIVGLILGIVGFFSNFGLVVPVAGILCSYFGRKKSIESGLKNKYATIGFILNGINLGVCIIGIVFLILFFIFYFILLYLIALAGV